MGNASEQTPVVVIGGSAGSLQPLRQIIAGLPPDLGAAVCIVIHIPEDSPSALATIIANTGALPASFAEEGSPLRPGQIHIAPPGHHLLVRDGHVGLSRGALENWSRPAIDPLFRTAATHLGSRVVSVLLSGTLDDGTAGTVAVARAGGITIVQDPADAQFPEMPAHAIATRSVRHVLPARRIPTLIEELVETMRMSPPGVPAEPGVAEPLVLDHSGNAPPNDPRGDHPVGDADGDSVDRGILGPALDLDPPASGYSCPACGGVLYEREPPLQYLCRLGHRYSPGSLVHDQEQVIEDALWVALRTLEEEASVAVRVRDRALARGDRGMELRFEARRAGAEARAELIRRLLRGEIRAKRGDRAEPSEARGEPLEARTKPPDARTGGDGDGGQAAPKGDPLPETSGG